MSSKGKIVETKKRMPRRAARLQGIFVIVLSLFSAACIANTPFGLDDKTPVPVRESYISLQKKTFISFKLGSAVVIGNGTAITNRHVVEGSAEIKGYMAGGIEFPIRNVVLSDRFDLAVFEIPPGLGKPIKIGKEVQSGDPIFSVGTTFSSTTLAGFVVFSDMDYHHVDIHLPASEKRDGKGRSVTRSFIYEGDFKKGFSGGPIVNSRGEVVGINQGEVLEFVSVNGESVSKPEKTYAIGYHIEDVLKEIRRIAPDKFGDPALNY